MGIEIMAMILSPCKQRKKADKLMDIQEALKRIQENTKDCERRIEQQKQEFIREISKREAALKEVNQWQANRIRELEERYPVKKLVTPELSTYVETGK